jgi:hypothetical protein
MKETSEEGEEEKKEGEVVKVEEVEKSVGKKMEEMKIEEDYDRNPEKRMKKAYKVFYEKTLPEMR